MVVPDMASRSETHRESKEKEPIKLALHANVNPDTLPFTYTKDKHVLSFTVENTGESMEIFKIKTTASYLYRIRPVFFKLGVRERQEVNVTYKGSDAGPIPLSAKDRITVVFAHALDPRKSTTSLWEMHKPYSHLSYAESREYVRVLFVDETGRLAVSAAHEKSRGGLEQRSIGGAGPRSITVRADPPRRSSVERDMTDGNNNQQAADEKSNNAADNEDAPPQPVQRAARTPRSPAAAAARTPGRAAASRTPSPHSKERKKSPAVSRTSGRDPIESLLSSVTKDASAIVCVQYPGKDYNRDEGSTVEEEEKSRRDEKGIKKDEDTKGKLRDQDTDARREDVLKKKVEEMRRHDEEEKQQLQQLQQKKKREEERVKSAEEKKRRDEEREERKKKEKEEDEAAEAEEKAAAAAAQQKPRRTSNEEVKQEQAEESPRPTTPRRKVLGADGNYHDDDSRYLDEQIRRQQASVRLLKKGARTSSKDNSAEDDKPRRTSAEDDN